jgi:hypothetical protein
MVLSLIIILLIVLVDILFICNEIKKYFLYALISIFSVEYTILMKLMLTFPNNRIIISFVLECRNRTFFKRSISKHFNLIIWFLYEELFFILLFQSSVDSRLLCEWSPCYWLFLCLSYHIYLTISISTYVISTNPKSDI